MAWIRRAREILLGLAVSPVTAGLLAGEARADERLECATAYERTQRAQQKSELIGALDSAERCARPTCPALLTSECSRWVTEVRQKLPGLVVHVKAADGCRQEPMRVDVIGATRKDPDSDTLLVDPGVHELTVVDPVSRRARTQTIDLAPRERRDIDVDFAPAGKVCGVEGKATSSPATTFPRTSVILGGIGGGLVVLGATIGLVGLVKRGGLDDCKPNCSSDRLDAVHPFFVAGDVAAGLGVLALGAAVVTFLAIDRPAGRTRIVFGSSGVGGSF